MRHPVILNFTADIEETYEKDGYGYDRHYTYVIVYCNGVEICRNDGDAYVDLYGDGGAQVAEIAAETLAKALNCHRT